MFSQSRLKEWNMRKIMGVVIGLCLALAFLGCGSSPSGGGHQGRAMGAFPDFVVDAIMNAPEDALMGIGTANMQTLAMSRTMSTNRARVEIAQTMNSVAQAMVRDYFAGNELSNDALAFAESISVTLTQADVSGARIVAQNATPDGTVWTVVLLDKATVTREINAAQAAARLAVPAMASFSAEDRMNAAFDRQAALPPGVNSSALLE